MFIAASENLIKAINRSATLIPETNPIRISNIQNYIAIVRLSFLDE